MPYIRRTRPWDFGRPLGRYALNQDCAQAQGLLAWWPMPGGIGVTRNWARGQVADMTPNGGMTWFADRTMGRVPNFVNASSQYLEYGAAVTQTLPFSMCCWFYPNNVTVSYALMAIGLTSGSSRFALNILGATVGDPVQALAANGGSSGSAQSTAGYKALKWQHGAAVFVSAPENRVYLDGDETSGAGITTPTGLNVTNLGTRYLSGARGAFLDGRLCDPRIYGRLLTAEDVAALYDPATRWDLYYPLGKKSWVQVSKSIAGGGGSTGAQTGPMLWIP